MNSEFEAVFTEKFLKKTQEKSILNFREIGFTENTGEYNFFVRVNFYEKYKILKNGFT